MTADLEKQVKELCAKAIAAEGEALRRVLEDLRAALREQQAQSREIVKQARRDIANKRER